MRIPIAIKYSLLFLSAILATSALLSWFFLDYMKVEMESELLKRGKSISRNLAYSVAPLLLSEDEAKISASLRNVLKEPDIETASVLNHQHIVMADSWPRRIGKPFHDPLFEPSGAKDSDRFESEEDDQIIFFQTASFGGVKVGSVVVRVSRKVLHIAIESATGRVLYITGIIAGIVILLSFITLSRTIKPLAKVLEGTKSISRGDFSTRLKVRSKDEIGDLATAFNDMAARTELFFRYVDKSIAERLVNDESLARPGGQLKQVSVLFGDMRDFTELSNQRSPSDVVCILNTYFDLFFQVVHHFGGVVDKTMGDAIMAFFEPSRSSDIDNSRSATLAAVSMKAACWVLEFVVREATRKKIAVPIETRKFGFAVATGRLIVGNIGSSRRMDYTVCGPAVNLASRLQMDTKQGQVLLDKFTAMDVEDIADLRELSQVRPKGFSEAQAVTPYQVIQVKPAEMVKIRSLLRRLFDKRFLQEHLTGETGESKLSNEQLEFLAIRADRRIGTDSPDFLVG